MQFLFVGILFFTGFKDYLLIVVITIIGILGIITGIYTYLDSQ